MMQFIPQTCVDSLSKWYISGQNLVLLRGWVVEWKVRCLPKSLYSLYSRLETLVTMYPSSHITVSMVGAD